MCVINMDKVIFVKCPHCEEDNPIRIGLSVEYEKVTMDELSLEGGNNE